MAENTRSMFLTVQKECRERIYVLWRRSTGCGSGKKEGAFDRHAFTLPYATAFSIF